MTEESLHLWEVLRAKVTHEDSWIQQRINWLLVSNAFLFAAYAALIAVDPNRSKAVLALKSCMLLLVPLLGIVLAVLVYVGLQGAREAIDNAVDETSDLLSKGDQKKLPSLHSKGTAITLGRLASSGIIISIGITWSLVLIGTLCVQWISLFRGL